MRELIEIIALYGLLILALLYAMYLVYFRQWDKKVKREITGADFWRTPEDWP